MGKGGVPLKKIVEGGEGEEGGEGKAVRLLVTASKQNPKPD